MTDTETENTIEEFEKIIHPYMEDGTLDITMGEYEGKPFAIFGGWESVNFVHGLINGFVGLGDTHWYGVTDFSAERVKLQAELAKAIEDKHYGTEHRLNKRIKDLDNYVLYKQYLHSYDQQEKDIGDFIEWGFNDEYDMCGCCHSNVVRTSPDCYSWTAPPYLEDTGYMCEECAESGDYNEDILEQTKNRSANLPDPFDAEALGLVQINDEAFENGWYGGQCDDPNAVIEALNEHDIDVWFKVYPRQFDCSFDAYTTPENVEKAKAILSGADITTEEDPADVLKRGLENASKAMSEMQGEGVKYAKINDDGSVDARVISKEDFIEKGIKE